MTDEELQAIKADLPWMNKDRYLVLLAEVERLRTGLALAWSDGWQAALDRPADAEQAIKYRDLQHYRQVQDILNGVTVD